MNNAGSLITAPCAPVAVSRAVEAPKATIFGPPSMRSQLVCPFLSAAGQSSLIEWPVIPHPL